MKNGCNLVKSDTHKFSALKTHKSAPATTLKFYIVITMGRLGQKWDLVITFDWRWSWFYLIFLQLPLIEILAQGQKAGFSSLQLCCIFQGRVLVKQSFYLPFLNSPGRLVVQELLLCSSHRHVCGSHRTWVPQSNHPSSTFTIPCLATGWLVGTCIEWDGIGIWELAKI